MPTSSAITSECTNGLICHIPSDVVVDQCVLGRESSRQRDFLLEGVAELWICYSLVEEETHQAE
jgi:hypothetical protein